MFPLLGCFLACWSPVQVAFRHRQVTPRSMPALDCINNHYSLH